MIRAIRVVGRIAVSLAMAFAAMIVIELARILITGPGRYDGGSFYAGMATAAAGAFAWDWLWSKKGALAEGDADG